LNFLNSSRNMSTGGEVANALVCKISIRGFNSRPVLQISSSQPSLLPLFHNSEPNPQS
jgi:hypothetical protein